MNWTKVENGVYRNEMGHTIERGRVSHTTESDPFRSGRVQCTRWFAPDGAVCKSLKEAKEYWAESVRIIEGECRKRGLRFEDEIRAQIS